MPEIAPVLIAGAGPTGLLLASELARRGVPCRLFEKHPQPLPFARASGVQARLVEVIDVMGAVEPFLARGTRQNEVVHVWQHEVVARMSFSGADSPYPFILGIGEGETIAFLTAHLEGLGVGVERSAEVVSCEQRDAEVVVEVRRDGTMVERVAGSYLVCCDGNHSAVREQLGDELEGFDYPTRYRVGVLQIEHWPFGENEVLLFDDESFAAQTLPDGYKILFDSMDEDEGPVELAQFQRLLDDVLPGHGLRGHDPAWMAAFTVHDRFAAQYRVGRVFVAGDAAHAISPINGQGMNLGLDDAYNLAWKLALVTVGAASDSLLDTYHAERRPVAAAAGQASDDKHRARSTRDHEKLQAMVDAAIAACADPEIVHAGAQAVGMLDTVYPPSTIVHDARPADRRGARSVGARLPTTLTLFDPDGSPTKVIGRLWDGEHRVLIVRAPTSGPAPNEGDPIPFGHRHVPTTTIVAAPPGAAGRRPAGDTVFEPDGRLHRELGLAGDGVVILRPDGYLGFIADLLPDQSPSTVARRYFDALR